MDWTAFTPIKNYDTDWASIVNKDKPLLANIFDDIFFWVNDAIEGRLVSIDDQRAKMLDADPSLNIRKLADGYDLEVERLNAIQQQSSKGFQVVDINPGLLNSLDNPLSLPYEFIFDGTNFLPDFDGNFVKNFRSVNVPIAGTFLKVEFIYENNSISNNAYTLTGPFTPARIAPSAKIKYSSAFADPDKGEFDLVTGQQSYTLDQYARNKVFIDFGTNSGKPHLVPSGGRVFKTYFNEVNITLNVGSPKVRITIGFNSEINDSNSVAPINARLALTGAGHLLADSDTTLAPFCLTEQNLSKSPSQYGMLLTGVPTSVSTVRVPLIQNMSFATKNFGADLETSYGYAVLWITRIYFTAQFVTPIPAQFLRVTLQLSDYYYQILGVRQERTVHNFKMASNKTDYVFEPSEPIRVVIPAGSRLELKLSYIANNVNPSGDLYVAYSLDGYSYGELLIQDFSQFGPFNSQVITSKTITDATFLSDFNRINSIKDP